MRCAWEQLLGILPQWLRSDVDQLDREKLQELRLRINAPPELVLDGQKQWLWKRIKREDLDFVINAASQYSPWRTASTANGYLTAPGGHRIGLCGEMVCREGSAVGIRRVDSLCIRVARDYSGLITNMEKLKGSVLILGAPGWGKTTLLRDLLRQLSQGETVAVVDERGEIFPEGFQRGKCMDVLTGCPKPEGIEILLRTMGPDCIAVDEITAQGDCEALIQAANCGVRLVATAHASSREDFLRRNVYRPLVSEEILDTLVILRRDKTCFIERMVL